MNFKAALTGLIIASIGLFSNAQTSETTLSVHHKLHQNQLANVKSRIDKSVISDELKESVVKREKDNLQVLSDESSKMVADLLKEGRKHIGKPYLAGSKGPSRFDCSGFTSYVYKQFGIQLSPSSRDQYTQGEKVDRNDLRPGDLVFFTSRRSGKNVGHVGIVVSADNETGQFKFIHASLKGVKISDYEGYYVPRYVGARRIITK